MIPRELIYTSATQGLVPGSRGFCVVASSSDMPGPVVPMLESLSAYRHVYTTGTETSLNPVSYSHFIVSSAGGPVHVVSRVGDAGLDYSRRTNMIAHHMLIAAGELEETDPAALLACDSLFRVVWNEQPRKLEPRTVSVPPLSMRVCRAWSDATGDAGWGGMLAAAGLAGRPVVIVYRPGQSILPLVAEALALLTVAERWRVSFSTFYQKLPPGVACVWKGVLTGSPEEGVARRIPHSLVFDLTGPFTAPNPATETDRLFVEMARTGVWKSRESMEKRLVVKKFPGTAVPKSAGAAPLEPYVPSGDERGGGGVPGNDGSYTPPIDSEMKDRLAQLDTYYADMATERKSRRMFPYMILLFLFASLLITCVVFLTVGGRRTPTTSDEQRERVPAAEKSPSVPTPPKPRVADKAKKPVTVGEKQPEKETAAPDDPEAAGHVEGVSSSPADPVQQ